MGVAPWALNTPRPSPDRKELGVTWVALAPPPSVAVRSSGAREAVGRARSQAKQLVLSEPEKPVLQRGHSPHCPPLASAPVVSGGRKWRCWPAGKTKAMWPSSQLLWALK